MDDFFINIGPLIKIQAAVDFHKNLAKLLLVIGGGLLAHQAIRIHEFANGGQNLDGIDRLDQIIADLRPNGLLHHALLFVFGDHHHRNMGQNGFDFGQGF